MEQNGRRLEPRRGENRSAGGGSARGAGLVYVVFGLVFVMMGLTALPAAGPMALLFVLIGGFFAVTGGLTALRKKSVPDRQTYPDETARPVSGPARVVGLIHMVFGTVFALVGLTALPFAGPPALLFALVGGFFAINGGRLAFGKRPTLGGQSYPDGAARPADSAPTRMLGMFFFVFGLVFALMGLALLASLGVFGLPFLIVGVVFAVVGGKLAFHITPAGGNGPYRGPEGPVSGFDPLARDHEHIVTPPARPAAPGFDPAARDHGHITAASMGHTPEKRLQQLETMREAGLIDDAEYRQKKREILAGR